MTYDNDFGMHGSESVGKGILDGLLLWSMCSLSPKSELGGRWRGRKEVSLLVRLAVLLDGNLEWFAMGVIITVDLF